MTTDPKHPRKATGKTKAPEQSETVAPSSKKAGRKRSDYYQATPESLAAHQNVAHLLKMAMSSVVRMADQAVAPLGLTAMQWRPLVMLRHTSVNTPAELARHVNVDTGAMTRTLDRLEAKHFLKRQRSTEDRRVVKLELTPTGYEVTNGILPAVAETLNHHFEGFTKAEIEQFIHYLQRFIVNGGGRYDINWGDSPQQEAPQKKT